MMKRRSDGNYVLEAQFWWAFSCLALAGRRTPANFHAELLRRGSGSYPAAQEVDTIVDEAVTHLPEVLNAALSQRPAGTIPPNGWERHLLALSASPGSAATNTTTEE